MVFPFGRENGRKGFCSLLYQVQLCGILFKSRFMGEVFLGIDCMALYNMLVVNDVNS